MSVGIYTKLYGYGLSIIFSFLIEVLKVFVGWVSADGVQGCVLGIDLFEIGLFGCSGNL